MAGFRRIINLFLTPYPSEYTPSWGLRKWKWKIIIVENENKNENEDENEKWKTKNENENENEKWVSLTQNK